MVKTKGDPDSLTSITQGWDSPAAMLRPSIAFSSFARLARAASLALLALATPACEEQVPEKKGPKTAADPAEQARIEQGRKLITEADEAINEKKYDQARKLLLKAQELANESQRFQIEEALEKVDKRQAKLWANEVTEDFKSKKCDSALKQLQEPLQALADSEAFTRELRRLVGADALACLQEEVDQKVLAFDYAGARKRVYADQTKTVLGPTAHKKLSTELEATILEGIRGQITAELKARKWAPAAEKIDSFAKKGDATEEQVESLLEAIREGVSPEINQLATRTLGQRDAPAALKQIDSLVKIAHWTIPDPAAAAPSAHAMPEELAKKRATLAVWVEAQHVAMRPLTRPEARFTHGKVEVHPADKADAPSKQDIPHGTQLWILGASKDRALVTTADPGSARLVDVLDKAVGWVPVNRLSKEKTADWLVPDDQLKGERVWGPLRQGDPYWELGVVMDVQGRDVTVQRLADGQNIKVPRAKLRSGRLAPGTRVITFCVAKDQPAQVVELPKTGRSAKLKCDGGQEKEEDLASLRSKPEILPTSK
ncbi:Hypothetical protein A7982_02323 [Minicystis rosea]|nr:Hypothetical protein A7982_02323 [Minicystis rosea]